MLPWIGGIRLGRDVEIRVLVSDKLAEHPLSAGPVRREARTFQVNLAEQFFSDSDIVSAAVTAGERGPGSRANVSLL